MMEQHKPILWMLNVNVESLLDLQIQVLNGKIHVFGGESSEGTFTENEAYDPSRDHWETMAPMPVGRHGLGSAVWGGKIHVLTGGPKPGGGGTNIHSAYQLPGP